MLWAFSLVQRPLLEFDCVLQGLTSIGMIMTFMFIVVVALCHHGNGDW